MKHLLTLLVVTAFSTLAPAAEALNTVCPISGKPANAAITSDYSKTVAVCCDRCVAQFNATPKAYLTNILTFNGVQCPLSKKKADLNKKVTYSRQVAFADATSKATFDSAPDKHIKEVRQ
jgi:YHS domain-containing protein